MATLAKMQNGTFQIQFCDRNKRIRTISLSQKKFTRKFAEELKNIVETLIFNHENGIKKPDKKLEAWLDSASPVIQEKLAKVDLIDIPERHTVAELWEKVLHVKEHDEKLPDSAINNYRVASRRFFASFKENTFLTELTKGEMLTWKQAMEKQYAKATVACTITRAKTVFNWAVKNGWMQQSPLAGVGRGSYVNRSKDREVTMKEYEKLLAACPCLDWKAIITLARIGGMRAPSEVLRLRWKDILWDKSRFYVTSNKTAHCGKAGRWVPLFPELRMILEELFSVSAENEYVINLYRDPETNIGTQFARIARKAGVQKIPRPFDNMRATRATEIYCEHGAYLESQWVGHTAKTAHEHYIQVRDVDFNRAAGRRTE